MIVRSGRSTSLDYINKSHPQGNVADHVSKGNMGNHVSKYTCHLTIETKDRAWTKERRQSHRLKRTYVSRSSIPKYIQSTSTGFET
jgi:hypothetical protein